MLQRFGDWRPTVFDLPRTHVPDGSGNYVDVGDWLVCPVLQTRDSDDLETSNFEQFTEALRETGPEDMDWQMLSFGHWGPGWVEILIVRPGSTAADTAEQLATHLADYPVLDEDDFSRREWDTAYETWQNMSRRDRMRVCRQGHISVFAARRDEIPALPYLDDLLGR